MVSSYFKPFFFFAPLNFFFSFSKEINLLIQVSNKLDETKSMMLKPLNDDVTYRLKQT